MKKSIFLFFAAILCATNAWGAKLFFDHSSVNYPADGALVAIWSWGGSSSDAWSVFKASGATNKIVADIADGRTGGKIVRFNSSVTKPDWNASQWNSTSDISFPKDKNCIKITSWNGATSGTWSTFQLDSKASVTPSASSVSVGEEVTFTPALTSNQEYNDVLSTTYSVGAGATITGGKFVATEAGTYTVTATVTYNAQGYTNITKTATATCSITVSEEAVPHPVTGVTIAPTSVTIKQGATTTLTATVAPSNADDPSVTWSSDNQSVATVVNGVVTAVAAGTANITVTTVDGGFTATCAVKVKPLQYTFYAINSAEWPTVAAHYWGGADGGSSWPGADMVKESETVNGCDIYSITISSDFINIMFTNQLNGEDKNKKTADLTTEGNDGKYYDIKDAKWYASLSEVPVSYDYYVTGSFNGWNEKDPAHGMTLDGEVYKATITLADGENLVKVTNGTWTDAKGFSAMGAEYEEVSAGASDDNIMVTLAAGKDVVVVYNATTKKVTFEGLTEKAPAPTFDYYICGSFNSNNPKNAENGMTLDGEVYKATVTLAEGDNTLKVTDGSWDNTWGYSNLGAAYDEVSDANDYNNIKITLAAEAEKEITVIFDATAGKITFEGLTPYVAPLTYTVTVPAGTEKCYIAGPKNDWSFQEMTATANENEFTITITGAKETDEYKYACQASWDYVEKKEDGNDLDNNRTWAANDVVAKWGVPPTYTVAGDNTAVFGTEWDAENFENDMTLQHDGTYVWTKPAVYLAGNVEFKVIKNKNWETAWPSDNYVINITESAFYNLTIYYNPTTNDITVVTDKLTAQTGSLSLEDVILEEMEYDGMNLLVLSGASSDWTTEVGIYLENYTSEDKAYNVYYESAITYNENYSMYNSVSGQLTQTTGVDGLRTFTGTLNVAFEGYDEETYESVVLPYQLTLTLKEKSDAATVVVVTDATVTLDAGLTMTGTWTDTDDTTYPVLVTVPGFDPSVASAELEAAVTVGGEGEFDPWLGFVEGLTTVTVEDGVVEVTGVLENTWAGVKLNVTISGTLPVAAPETYTRTVTNGEWGTICLPYASSSVTGATFYEVSSLVVGQGLWLDQLADGAQLEAGKPYIFQATSTEIAVTYTGAEAAAPVAGANGLTGTFTEIAAGGALVGNYIIAENQVWSAGTGATLSANRAYIKNTVPTTPQAQLPGRRRVRMGAEDEGTSTGFENITTTDKTVKIIENGQLIIIRDGMKYNAMGVKL